MTEFTFLGELSLSAHKNTRFTQKSQLQEKYQLHCQIWGSCNWGSESDIGLASFRLRENQCM